MSPNMVIFFHGKNLLQLVGRCSRQNSRVLLGEWFFHNQSSAGLQGLEP